MNKILLSAAMAVAGVCALQAANPTNAKMWMEAKEAQSEWENFQYTYNEQNLCDSTISFRFEQEYPMYVNFGYRYNERGQQVAEYGYQRRKISGTDELSADYTNTMRVFYTYDDLHRMTQRINYNLFGNTWERGGIYVYSYEGESDKMIKRQLYWDEALTDLYEETTYSYDAQGRIAKEEYAQMAYDANTFAPLGIMNTSYVEYEYNDQGQLLYRNHYDFDFENDNWKNGGHERLTYSEGGDITEQIWYANDANNPTQKYVYDFRDELRADVCYPVNIEDQEEFYNIDHSAHAVKSQTVYAVDQNAGTLNVFDIYDFVYSTERPQSGVAQNFASAKNVMRYADGKVELDGFTTYTHMNVYDLAGHRLAGQTFMGSLTVDLSDYPAGAYIITAGERTMKIVK